MYQYICLLTQQRYICETKKNLLLVSPNRREYHSLQGLFFFNPPSSPIRTLWHDLNHALSDNYFKIVRKANHPYYTKLIVSLYYIHNLKWTIKTTSASHLSYSFTLGSLLHSNFLLTLCTPPRALHLHLDDSNAVLCQATLTYAVGFKCYVLILLNYFLNSYIDNVLFIYSLSLPF